MRGQRRLRSGVRARRFGPFEPTPGRGVGCLRLPQVAVRAPQRAGRVVPVVRRGPQRAVAPQPVPQRAVLRDLRERPGQLVIKASDGALLTIDGRYVATTPLPRALEIEPGHHLIVLAKNGYHAHTEEIDVGRAETRTLDVSLGATKQRVASYVLLGAGAAGILVGGVFAGLAAHQQSLAQTIDVTRQTKGYDCRDTTVECPTKAYQNAVDQRNQLRPIAGVALTAGAVVAATGAVLFLFDQPSLDARAARSDSKPRPAAPPPKATPLEISAAPAIGPGFYGGSFVGRF